MPLDGSTLSGGSLTLSDGSHVAMHGSTPDHRPGEPSSNMVPGMAAPLPPEKSLPKEKLTLDIGGKDFPLVDIERAPGERLSIIDTSMDPPLQVPLQWFFDFDPNTGNARASFPGVINGTFAVSPILNNGTITGILTNAGTISGGAIAGPVTNSGTFFGGRMQAPVIVAGTISQSTIGTATVAGSIVNNGTIKGGVVSATSFHNGSLTGTVSNTGFIIGGSLAGVTIENSTISGTVTNNGSITGGVYSGSNSIGVTNGSSAPAGDVGEVASINSSGTTFNSGGSPTLATLALSAGDWEVVGFMAATPSASGCSFLGVGLNTSAAFPSLGTQSTSYRSDFGAGTIGNSSFLVTQRFLFASAQTLFLIATATTSAGSVTVSSGNATILARRMR